MRFYVSDATHTSRPPTGVLHVTQHCATVKRSGRTVREAAVPEINDAYTLCGICAPRETGQMPPFRRYP